MFVSDDKYCERKVMKRYFLATALILSACSEQPGQNAEQDAASPVIAASDIAVQSGEYTLDPNHATLVTQVLHLGLSNYAIRFPGIEGQLVLDTDKPEASSINLTVKMASATADYSGDFKATHPESEFDSWDAELSQGDKFFNSGTYSTATFKSTAVEKTGDATAKVTGDLTFLGQTQPVTLDVVFTGAGEHPFRKVPGVGINATGSFKRSLFGSAHLLGEGGGPDLVSDTVKITFNGEFLGAAPAAVDTPAS